MMISGYMEMPEQIRNFKDIIGLTIIDAIPVIEDSHSIKLIFSNSFVMFTGKNNYTEYPDVVVDAKTENLPETHWYSKKEREG